MERRRSVPCGVGAPALIVALSACVVAPGRDIPLAESSGPSAPSSVTQSSGGDPGGSPLTPAAHAPTPLPAHAGRVGRVLGLDPLAPDHLRLAWSGSGAALHFTGTGASANLGDANLPPSGSVAAFAEVWVDGNLLSALPITGAQRDVVLAEGLGEGEHEILLRKRTDGDIGVIDLGGFTLAAGGAFLDPPAPRARRILVMGASIEVGFGVVGNDQNCATFAAGVEDQSLAWPQLTADLLGADLENLSLPARGLLATATSLPDANHTSTALFFQTDPAVPGHLWDANAHPVDVVAFNLGANDWHFFGEGAPPKATFEGTFVALVRAAQKSYPNAAFYLTVSPTHTGDERTILTAYYSDVVATLTAGGLTQASVFTFTPATGLACWGHPDTALHRAMATEFAAQVAADLGWPAPGTLP